jgi:hypothetical protein
MGIKKEYVGLPFCVLIFRRKMSSKLVNINYFITYIKPQKPTEIK